MKTEFRCAIEVRADETRRGPGRLTGVLITEGEQAGDRREVFAPGALSWPDTGILLRRQHVREMPIARIVPKREGNKIIVDEILPDTLAGRDCAAEVRAGLFKGLSIEFVSKKESFRAGLRQISAAVLDGAGLVDSPSYSGSLVSVRSKGTGRRSRTWL